jgi:hypothetical protein
MRMAAEDGNKLAEDTQKIMKRIADLLRNSMEHRDVSTGLEASREELMKLTNQSDAPVEDERVPRDWAKLIRKLRWIGLEDQARRLQLAVRTLPPEERGSVSAGPFSTD